MATLIVTTAQLRARPTTVEVINTAAVNKPGTLKGAVAISTEEIVMDAEAFVHVAPGEIAKVPIRTARIKAVLWAINRVVISPEETRRLRGQIPEMPSYWPRPSCSKPLRRNGLKLLFSRC